MTAQVTTAVLSVNCCQLPVSIAWSISKIASTHSFSSVKKCGAILIPVPTR